MEASFVPRFHGEDLMSTEVTYVRLNDLCFDAKYFHSATVRVSRVPSGEFECFVVVVLFTQGGLREYGAQNGDIADVVRLFNSLLRQLHIPELTEEETAQMVAEKHQEVEFHRSSQASTEEAARKANQEVGASDPRPPSPLPNSPHP